MSKVTEKETELLTGKKQAASDEQELRMTAMQGAITSSNNMPTPDLIGRAQAIYDFITTKPAVPATPRG